MGRKKIVSFYDEESNKKIALFCKPPLFGQCKGEDFKHFCDGYKNVEKNWTMPFILDGFSLLFCLRPEKVLNTLLSGQCCCVCKCGMLLKILEF